MYMLQKINNKQNNVIFHIDKYNTKNEIVKKALSNHVSDTNVCEMICKSSHNGLCKPVPTMSKHTISIHGNITTLCKCILCECKVDEKTTHEFHMEEYNENVPPLKHLLQNRTWNEINGRICKNCHAKLQCHSIVKCQ